MLQLLHLLSPLNHGPPDSELLTPLNHGPPNSVFFNNNSSMKPFHAQTFLLSHSAALHLLPSCLLTKVAVPIPQINLLVFDLAALVFCQISSFRFRYSFTTATSQFKKNVTNVVFFLQKRFSPELYLFRRLNSFLSVI